MTPIKKYHVIIPQGMQPLPESFELSAADILAGFFQADVKFLPVTSNKTPDIVVGNIRWEIKSPKGKGKHTIEHQFQRAAKQSKSIVIDARRCKLHIARIRSQVRYQTDKHGYIRQVVLIEKTGKVMVIK
jgi:hypothetical protein